MDTWKFYAVTHGHLMICNPLSESKIDEVVGLLPLLEHARVLDIACDKGELLRRLIARWNCGGVGVDISPYFVGDARRNLQSANLESRAEIIEADARQYIAEPGSFDASVCLGASWIWDGFVGTLRALQSFTKPGGVMVVGEPFWKRKPSEEYLQALKIPGDIYSTHFGNIQAGLGLQLQFLHAVVSSDDDWDRYEGYQWHAAEDYARENPGDPDSAEILMNVHESRDHYLRWGRDEMGWAVYMFLCAA